MVGLLSFVKGLYYNPFTKLSTLDQMTHTRYGVGYIHQRFPNRNEVDSSVRSRYFMVVVVDGIKKLTIWRESTSSVHA